MASVKQLPSGMWRARLDKDPVTGREPTRHFTRKTDGQNWINEQTADKLTGRYVDPRSGKITLAQFYEPWADLQVWQPTTRRQYDRAITASELAHVALAQITDTHGAQWVKRMRKQPLAPATILARVTYLSIVLRAAVKAKKISENPFADLVLPKLDRREDRMVIPTQAEVAQIRAAADDYMELVVCLGAYTGLRIGEIAALQVGDIGFLTRSLRVERQIQYQQIRPPKHGSKRTVYPPDELLELLGKRVWLLDDSEPRWLFPGRIRGRPTSENTLGVRWDGLRKTKAVNLPALDFRAFRHFYASGLIAAGCDVVQVQRAMGHSSSAVTLEVYTHLWPQAEDKTRAAAAALMRGSVHDPSDSRRTPKIR